jgi:tetratricopeptide (TPR) repeat protein
MIRCKLTFAVALSCFVSGTAGAAVTVIGSSNARLCYEAAERESIPDRRQMEQCDTALKEATLSLADIVATHVNRGILRSRSGDISGALVDFDHATSLDPNEPEAYLNKGLVLTIKVKDARKALPLFGMALERNTIRPELAYFGRAAAYEELGNLRLAYADYSQAVAAAPKWQQARAELARFQVRR